MVKKCKSVKNLNLSGKTHGLDFGPPDGVAAPSSQVGYCPEEDGKVVQLPRGIRYAKKRKGPSAPSGKVNWTLGEDFLGINHRDRDKILQ